MSTSRLTKGEIHGQKRKIESGHPTAKISYFLPLNKIHTHGGTPSHHHSGQVTCTSDVIFHHDFRCCFREATGGEDTSRKNSYNLKKEKKIYNSRFRCQRDYMCPLFSRRSILAVLRVVNRPLDSVEFFSVIPIFSDQKWTVASRIRTQKPKI